MGTVRHFIVSMRPRQAIKNFFVIAPLFFSKKLKDPVTVLHVLLAFILFCLLSGSVYLINDVIDAERDKLHPLRSSRPITSGLLSRRLALLGAGTLALLSFFLSYIVLGGEFLAVGVFFWTINLVYSCYLKNVPILDVIVIAVNFVMRVVAGGIAVMVPSSHWILLSTIFLALFLGFGKRRGEAGMLEAGEGENHRPVLGKYSVELLDKFLVITATGAIMSYSLYTTSDYAFERFGTHDLVYTVPFVIYGILRYLYLIHIEGLGESPTEALYLDRPLMINVVLWLISVVLIVGT